MAEVLGVASSVAGLITLADIVVRKGYKFLKEVKEADKTVKKLVDEVNNLAGILHSLHNIVETLEEDGSGFDPSTQIHYVESCYQTLNKLRAHFDKALPRTPMSKIDRIVWPLKQSHTKELLEEIGRHKATMVLAMSATEMSALLQLLSRQETMNNGIDAIMAGLEGDRAERRTVLIDSERQKMLDFLEKFDPGRWQDTNIRLRQPGTGVWFTDSDELRQWASTARSSLWVYGIPGAGKTVLIASTIQEIQRQLRTEDALAFFYCDYKNTDTHNATTILGSLARQLVVQSEDCLTDLTEFYRRHVKPNQIVQTPSADELCALISKLSSHYRTTMIVVDGLDEISEDRASITRLLQSLKVSSTTIKTLFASRPEVDIRDELEDAMQISIAARSSDLRLYVAAEIEKRTKERRLRIRDPDLKEHIMKTLVDGADGMFRWVSCQMDYLCECSTDKDRCEALQKLPPDLPSSYERILDRVNRSTRQNQLLVQHALHWIVYAEGTLTTDQLLQALAVDDQDDCFDSSGMTTEDELLHWCSSLVRQNVAGDSLELAHFTVKEFLCEMESTRPPTHLRYSLSGDNLVLAKACVNFLRCRKFDGRPPADPGLGDLEPPEKWISFEEAYPFIKYAAAHVFYHVHESDWNEMREDVMRLFTSKHHGTFKFWSSVVLAYHRRDVPKDFTSCLAPAPLHLAARFALDRVCARLLRYGSYVNKSSYLGTPLSCAILAEESGYEYDQAQYDHIHQSPTWRRYHREEVLRMLLSAGAEVQDRVRPDGYSMLSAAIRVDRHIDVPIAMDALLSRGAIFSPCDFDFMASSLESFDQNMPDTGGREELSFWLTDTVEVGLGPVKLINRVLDTNGTNMTQNAYPNFISYVLQALAWGCPLEALSNLFDLEPGLFSTEEVRNLSSKRSCSSRAQRQSLIETLCSAIFRTTQDLEASYRIFQDVLGVFVKECDLSGTLLILDKVPDLNLYHQNKDGESYLSLACNSDYTEESKVPMIRVLLAFGIPAIYSNNQHWSPLDFAVKNQSLKIFQMLWDSMNAREVSESLFRLAQRYLCMAIYFENTAVAEFLTQKFRKSDTLQKSSILRLFDTESSDSWSWASKKVDVIRAKMVEWFRLYKVDGEGCIIVDSGSQGAGTNREVSQCSRKKLQDLPDDESEDALDDESIEDLCGSFDPDPKSAFMRRINRKALNIIAGPQVPQERLKDLVRADFFPTEGGLSIRNLVHALVQSSNASAVEKLRILLDLKPEVLESANAEGLTPLLHAAYCGQEHVARFLLSCGADTNAIPPQDAALIQERLVKYSLPIDRAPKI